MEEETLGAAAGFIAGITNALAVGPLDVVKARQQIQRRLKTDDTQSLRYRGTLFSLVRIYKEEGIRGLYRGFQPTVIGYAPAWAIYFTCYNKGRAEFSRRYPDSPKDLGIILSAVSSGAIANTVTNPVWVIRTRLQTQEHVTRSPEYLGTFDAAKKIYSREGIFAFYKGMVPSMWGLIHVAIQFPLYEKFKLALKIDEIDTGDRLSLDHALRLIMASSASKLLASLMTYPLEVVRTRMQVQRSDSNIAPHYTTVLGSLKTIIHEEGVRGLYTGLQTNLIRVVPACAITFTTYELVFRTLRRVVFPPPIPSGDYD